MEKDYNNLMEVLVADKLDTVMMSLDCCKCPQCRSDIIAYALNRLPTKYVSTKKGEVYSKLYSLNVQHEADILSAIADGIRIVTQDPRH